FLETYNSLTDKHLVGYFSNARIRRHLQKSGLWPVKAKAEPQAIRNVAAAPSLWLVELMGSKIMQCWKISRSGRIIPEREYRLNAMRREQQRCVRECLADAIFRKVLDMERHHQREMKNNLDCSVRKDRMQPIKMEPIRESMEEIFHVRCPHPPLAPRNHLGLCPLVAAERAGCSHCSSLAPNRAPGHLQQPPRLQPLHGWAAAGSAPKASKQKCHALEREQQCARGGERRPLRIVNSVEYLAVSPYQLPVTCPCALPAPPPRPRRGNRRVPALGSALPERRFHPTTAFNEQVLVRNTRGFPKSPLCSNAFVTMIYLGRSKHVSLVCKDEIKVYQQYCGTENICVYRGELLEGDTFQFISKRHLGFPFSLTFFLNETEVERLSSCCEYRHLRCPQLRRRNSYFRMLHVAGAPPCYKCIIAMGLDRKLNPPKRKARSHGMKYLCPWECALHCEPCEPCEPCDSSFEHRSREDSASGTVRGGGTSAETVEKALETEEESSEEEIENQSSEEDEDNEEDTEYEEDFEAYEEVNEEGQTGDQMNGMSDDKNRNLDYGKESATSSQKALGASDREKNENDGYSDVRDSEDDLQERRPADSLSSMGTQCSTETDSHAEMMTDNVNGKEDCNCKRTSESAAHVHYGNENGEKKLLRTEENQETSALEKKGIDEAEKTKPEDLTAREDTRISHENIMAMQHQNPEVNGEFKQTGSGESNMNEEEKCAPVPWGSRVLNREDGSAECPCEEGVFEDCKPVQEEIAKASGNDHAVNSDPEPGDSCANEEEKNAANTECGASGGGSSLAEGRRSRAVQEGRAARQG
ncbi:Glutamate-rich protein 3, partial [Lamprotornis superbus]